MSVIDMSGHVVLVTGGAGHIGTSIARAMLDVGAVPVLLDRDADRLDAVAEGLGDTRVATHAVDVANESALQAAVTEVADRYGRLDVAVAGAGVMDTWKIDELTTERLLRSVELNLASCVATCRAVMNPMRRAGYGRIVTVSSNAALVSRTVAGTAYSISKAAVIHLTRQLAVDLGSFGITVNCIAPATIDTRMARSFGREVLESAAGASASGRIGVPDDVAGAVVFLASPHAGYVNGTCLPITGGN